MGLRPNPNCIVFQCSGALYDKALQCFPLLGVDYVCRTALATAGLVKAMGCKQQKLQEQKHNKVSRLVHKQRIQTFPRAIPKFLNVLLNALLIYIFFTFLRISH